MTDDGLERTFALNHMSYFLLTVGLLERLAATGGARIVNTASAAPMQGAILDFDDLQSAKNFRAIRAYSRSKLCNILFTRELARRLRGTGVTTNCLHPGFVAVCALVMKVAACFRPSLGSRSFSAISPAKGAETIIYLASSPTVANITGLYFHECQPVTPSPAAMDDHAALVLWQRSAALAGIPA